MFLQRGELGAREDAEGDYAADEGLEQRGAKDSTVAGGPLMTVWLHECIKKHTPQQVVARGVLE